MTKITLQFEETPLPKANIGKLTNYFKTLSEKEENLLVSALMDYLYFVKTYEDIFKPYFAMLYRKYNNDTIYQYFLEHVIKNPKITHLLNNFEVLIDVREYINYYYSKSIIFTMQQVMFEDIDEKIKHYFEGYSFVAEVQAIIKYCKYHYRSIEAIPTEYKPRIIRKIETTLFLRNVSDAILETFSPK